MGAMAGHYSTSICLCSRAGYQMGLDGVDYLYARTITDSDIVSLVEC